MTMTPIDLFSDAIRLHDGWQLAAFHAQTDADVHADHWEVHDEGEEVVCCLDGRIRLYFRGERPGGEEEIKMSAGRAVIVPRGQWHRIELDTPSDVMALTMRRGTRLEKRTEG